MKSSIWLILKQKIKCGLFHLPSPASVPKEVSSVKKKQNFLQELRFVYDKTGKITGYNDAFSYLKVQYVQNMGTYICIL
jgi:hypothetical protein